MNIWECLGIRPTTDRSEIRSAYAQMAKSCHPEEHPEEFKELQKAYKAALRYAKYKAQTTEIHREEDGPEKVSAPENIPEPLHNFEETAPETVFDFSGIDSYGEQEQFFRLFFLIAYNPCLINNLLAWEIFLQHPSFGELFHNPVFRLEFVHRICGLYGLKRDTVLLFERHLQAYQNREPENQPPAGVSETELACFRKLKRRCIWPVHFGAEYFTGKEGKKFQNAVMTVFDRQGRVLDLGRKADMEDYMGVYFSFACANEEKLAEMYRSRKSDQRMNLGCAVFLIAGVLAITGEWLVGKWDESRERAAYAQEMEQLQEDPVWTEEMKMRAEADMDHIWNAYQQWAREQDTD